MTRTEIRKHNGKILGAVLGHFDMYTPTIVLADKQVGTFDYRDSDETLYRGDAYTTDGAVNAYCVEQSCIVERIDDWWYSNSENVVVLALVFKNVKLEEES